MRVRRTEGAGDRRSDEVLAHDEFDNLLRARAQATIDDLVGQDDLGDDIASASEDPVDRGGLLVRAVVARHRAVVEAQLPGQDGVHERIRGLGDHVVPRGVVGAEGEADEEQVPDDLGVDLDEPAVAGPGLDDGFEFAGAVTDGLRGRLGADRGFGHEQHRPGHPLIDDDGADPTFDLNPIRRLFLQMLMNPSNYLKRNVQNQSHLKVEVRQRLILYPFLAAERINLRVKRLKLKNHRKSISSKLQAYLTCLIKMIRLIAKSLRHFVEIMIQTNQEIQLLIKKRAQNPKSLVSTLNQKV